MDTQRLYGEAELEAKITFTRGRSGKKNDGCFVEQKNYSVVRRAMGYARYDAAAQMRLLNELSRHLRLYIKHSDISTAV